MKPAEVRHVNGAYVDIVTVPVVGATGLTYVSGIRSQSAITLELEGGGKVTVKGRLDVDITTTSGHRYRFDHPVRATLTEDILDVRSASRSGRVPLGQVRAADVRSFDTVKTVIHGVGIAVAGDLGATALLLSI